ncbi:MAG: hypothetical protein M1814_005811 [Vezdaea aestivalis]|nr:MAG: hypothetical protein M1814_005811 [Vezdaea aestivalis]
MKFSAIVSLLVAASSVAAIPTNKHDDKYLSNGSPFHFAKTFHVTATPDQVINGTVRTPGQPGAKGIYKFGIAPQSNTICFNITLYGVSGAYQSLAFTSTHIHEGAAGASGPPRIVFPNPVGDDNFRISLGCVTGPFKTNITAAGKDTGEGFHVQKIIDNPTNFFADAHTARFVPGVVRVYAVDRLPEPSSEFLQVQQHAAEKFGTELHYRQVDVRNVEELNDIVKVIGDDCGRLDGLVAAAGIQQETPALTFTAKDANTIFEVNITGVFMTAQAVARQMIRFGNGGSIVMIASMSGHVANRGLTCTAYNASKAGVLQLARSLASEWGEHGIRVNTISPGYIVTAMVEELFKKHPERRRDWPTQNMLGRLSTPEEYRGAAVFLISNASSFMTGADLRMDGGHTAW